MEHEFVQVKDHKHLVRDPYTNGIINTDVGEYDEYIARREAAKQEKAKSSNMPMANIDRAVKKGTGDLPGVVYDDFIYEGYGPSGVAIMMEVMTDNKNRTIPEIRHIMSKNSGNLGESGCVSWMFEKKGIILVQKNNINEDQFLSDLFDLDIDDFGENEDEYEIFINPEDFSKTTKLLEKKGYHLDGNLSLMPINIIEIDDDKLDKVVQLIELLEEHDDVQKVHANL